MINITYPKAVVIELIYAVPTEITVF